MPWRMSDVKEERLRFVALASRKRHSMTELCREFGISRPTGYEWLARYKAGGSAAVLEQRSSRPHDSPQRTDAAREQILVELRKQRPDWGARKLVKGFLGGNAGVCPAPSTVHRILLRNGLVAPEDRHRPAVTRYERSRPNELWQIDFKGPQEPGWHVGPLSMLDDYSRYLVTLRQLSTNTRAEGVRACLRETFEKAGMPEEMLMDHGTPWWNAHGGWGWTELTVWLMRQGIRLHFSGIRHPQTQGKVERMHRTLKTATRKRGESVHEPEWLERFRNEYNQVRPHEALQMQTPASRWTPSQRRFQSAPREWEYPASSTVIRLGGQGQLRWRGQRWEISRALHHQNVGIELIGDHAVVYFCSTPLKQLDPKTRTTQNLPTHPFSITVD